MRISLRLVKLLVKHAIVRDGSSDTRSVQSGNVATTLIGIYTYIYIYVYVLVICASQSLPDDPSAAACAPLRRRSVMEGGPCPLLASAPASGSRQVILNKAGSAVPLVPPCQPHVLVRGLWKPSLGIACRGVCCRE